MTLPRTVYTGDCRKLQQLMKDVVEIILYSMRFRTLSQWNLLRAGGPWSCNIATSQSPELY